jgi:cytochrome P450
VKPTLSEVVADGGLTIIAGSDTAATAMSNIFYFLLSDPAAYARLQNEVDIYFSPSDDPFDSSKLAQMPYLNAVMSVIAPHDFVLFSTKVGTVMRVCA